MNPRVPPPSRVAVSLGGAAFFGLSMPFVWCVATIVTAQQATSRLQDESIGYTMFLTMPAAALLGGLTGLIVGAVGDPTRWLRRWAVVAVVGTLLAVAFNVYLFTTTRPAVRPTPSARA